MWGRTEISLPIKGGVAVSYTHLDVYKRQGMIDTLMWILGCLLYAIAMNVFNVPNQIAPGGVSGIATLLNHLFHTPIGVMVMAINVPIFLIAWKFLGWRFLLNSMIATVLLSVSIDVTALFLPAYQGDRLLAALFGGVRCV